MISVDYYMHKALLAVMESGWEVRSKYNLPNPETYYGPRYYVVPVLPKYTLVGEQGPTKIEYSKLTFRVNEFCFGKQNIKLWVEV